MSKAGRGTKTRAVVGPLNVAARLKELGCDPIEGLTRIAVDPNTPPGLRRATFRKLSDFALPGERAVEILRRLLESPRAEELFG